MLAVEGGRIKLLKPLDLSGRLVTDVLSSADRIYFRREGDFKTYSVYANKFVVRGSVELNGNTVVKPAFPLFVGALHNVQPDISGKGDH